MSFQSPWFYACFPLLMLAYAFVPARGRAALLLAVSLSFYACFGHWHLLAALFASAIASWGLGVKIAASGSLSERRAWYWLGLALNLGLMFGLKFAPGPIAFVGVSYFVFQAVSYLSDVHLGLLKPEEDFKSFLLYFAFFPRLVQGPIERAQGLIPQLKSLQALDPQNVREGALRFAWGLFKKTVVADRSAFFVSSVFDNLKDQSGPGMLLGIYCFAIQIYFDFSGYTDMALGAAQIFGVRLTPNFDAPYLARSTADFWRRWHISFSTWVKDYMFEPLQLWLRNWGNFANIAVFALVFPLVGLWHGANFGFLAWGCLQALYMSVGILIKPLQKKFYKGTGLDKGRFQKIWRIFITFHLACFSMMFYRLDSLEKARLALSRFGVGWSLAAFPVEGRTELLWLALAVILAIAVHFLKKRAPLLLQAPVLRWSAYYALALAILLGGKFFEARNFIYAQF